MVSRVDGAGVAEQMSMVVAPFVRGKRVGDELVETATRWAETRGVPAGGIGTGSARRLVCLSEYKQKFAAIRNSHSPQAVSSRTSSKWVHARKNVSWRHHRRRRSSPEDGNHTALVPGARRRYPPYHGRSCPRSPLHLLTVAGIHRPRDNGCTTVGRLHGSRETGRDATFNPRSHTQR